VNFVIAACETTKAESAIVESLKLVKIPRLFALLLSLICLIVSCGKAPPLSQNAATPPPLISRPTTDVQSNAQTDDPVASFQRGVSTVEERKNNIFGQGDGETEVRYDIKRTDSLVSPIVGVITVGIPIVLDAGGPSYNVYEFQFSYRDGKWTLADHSNYLRDSSGVITRRYARDTSFMPDHVQECFNTQ
jgi:hypothetical protein